MGGLTKKERHKRVSERSQGLCELCKGNNNVQRHHVIKGSGKRSQCETYDSLKDLCYSCHHGTNGVHGKNGAKLDRQLKEQLQKRYIARGYSEEDIFYLMGDRNYL